DNFYYIFFLHGEDGIRAFHVTEVQTCALPISRRPSLTLTRPCARSTTPQSMPGIALRPTKTSRIEPGPSAISTIRAVTDAAVGKIGRASCRDRMWISPEYVR